MFLDTLFVASFVIAVGFLFAGVASVFLKKPSLFTLGFSVFLLFCYICFTINVSRTYVAAGNSLSLWRKQDVHCIEDEEFAEQMACEAHEHGKPDPCSIAKANRKQTQYGLTFQRLGKKGLFEIFFMWSPSKAVADLAHSHMGYYAAVGFLTVMALVVGIAVVYVSGGTEERKETKSKKSKSQPEPVRGSTVEPHSLDGQLCFTVKDSEGNMRKICQPCDKSK